MKKEEFCVRSEITSEDISIKIRSIVDLSNEVTSESRMLRDFLKGDVFGPAIDINKSKTPNGFYNTLEASLEIIKDNLYEIRRAIEVSR